MRLKRGISGFDLGKNSTMDVNSSFETEKSNVKEDGKISTPQLLFESLVGAWEGMTRAYVEPGVLADEKPFKATILFVIGDSILEYNYRGAVLKRPFVGKLLFGYNEGRRRFEAAWIDSYLCRSAIMYLTGSEWLEGQESDCFAVTGTYPDLEGGPDWSWRVEFRVLDAENIVVSHFNIKPTGEEYLAIETAYELDCSTIL